ncbi:polysaccharide pyruvyl transferase family protein [Robertmurraya yapensis]|uniref:Polysaccharide pyruvyl transferase family protein n=1 Tax=Bacillus yapensis TaxID=2492960 RepID=A0A431W3J0_9BACI|nr:polysaccharide pyruvyl transferase family protein [Bacillus yapensis]TKS95086.1 polysaccharide pyruvyl transferase family protein [Bacillus yapensis]
MSLYKRVLVYAYFAKNTGDDLFLKILFDRYPDVHWDLLTANRNYNTIFKDYEHVHIIYSYREIKVWNQKFNLFFKLNDLILNYNKYDALVIIGGSIFMESPAWKIKYKERAYLVDKFQQLNKKTFIIGANFGPYKDQDFMRVHRDLFSRVDDVCFRDIYSFKLFNDLDNVRIAPDVVFNLQVNKQKKKMKSIGFSLINLNNREGLKDYQEHYQNKMIELAKQYLKKGYRIKIFSFCENEGDLDISNYIKEQLRTTDVEVKNYEGDLNGFLDDFKACEIIIGTRFHSIILALLYEQSVFPIIYNEKTFNVLKDLNLEKNSWHLHNIQDLQVKNAMDKAIYKAGINNKLFIEANKQFEKLDLYIG